MIEYVTGEDDDEKEKEDEGETRMKEVLEHNEYMLKNLTKIFK